MEEPITTKQIFDITVSRSEEIAMQKLGFDFNSAQALGIDFLDSKLKTFADGLDLESSKSDDFFWNNMSDIVEQIFHCSAASSALGHKPLGLKSITPSQKMDQDEKIVLWLNQLSNPRDFFLQNKSTSIAAELDRYFTSESGQFKRAGTFVENKLEKLQNMGVLKPEVESHLKLTVDILNTLSRINILVSLFIRNA
jgi:hypothetical protein